MTEARLIPVRQITPPDWMMRPGTLSVMNALSDGAAPKALFVGGCVRNTLMGLPSGDIDIATTWSPDEATARLEGAGIKVVPTGIAHGTVTAVACGETFEITTLRRDVETDGRHAVVAFSGDWREDARRRDFTMNTLLADRDGDVYDPLDRGVIDAEAGRVVFVGDPAQRIAEDHLRILRFFRFHAFYGRGAMDLDALTACRDAAAKLGGLSRERITQEFMKLLSVAQPGQHLGIMRDNNVLPGLLQTTADLAVLDYLCVLQVREGQMSQVARLIVLANFDAAYRTVLEKYLVFSNAQKRSFDDITNAENSIEGEISESRLKRLIYQWGANGLQAALLFAARGHNDAALAFRSVASWIPPSFPLTGHDAKIIGLPQGRRIGELLRQAEQWWIDQDFLPTREACLDQLLSIANL